jgi:hypothetical protein
LGVRVPPGLPHYRPLLSFGAQTPTFRQKSGIRPRGRTRGRFWRTGTKEWSSGSRPREAGPPLSSREGAADLDDALSLSEGIDLKLFSRSACHAPLGPLLPSGLKQCCGAASSEAVTQNQCSNVGPRMRSAASLPSPPAIVFQHRTTLRQPL